MSQLAVKRELVLTSSTAQYIADGDGWCEYYLDFIGNGLAVALSSPRITDAELRTLLQAVDIIAREDSFAEESPRDLLVKAALRRIADGKGDLGYSEVTYGE